MNAQARRRALALFPLLVLLLNGCAGTGDHGRSYESTGTFPVAPEIQPNVDFWRKVYGVWGRGQVAFHDDEYMGVIYEVADLPGYTGSGYSSDQRHYIAAKEAWYAGRLKSLEQKVRRGDSLSRDERALQDKLVDAGGKGAIYGASERVRAQRGIREKFRRGLEISGRYDETFREIFRSRGLPEDLAYLPHVESSFQVNARSGVGAAGIWQFMPATGRVYGMTVSHAVDDRLDPVVAAEGAASYLGSAHAKLRSWPLAITSYNHGQGGMANAKAIYGTDFGAIATRYKGPYFGFSSRNFYAQFLAAREVAGNPKKYFPEGVNYQSPQSRDRVVLRSTMPAHHVANHYGVSTYRLADLNLHWRDSAVSGRAPLPAGTTVWLPDGTLSRVAEQPRPVYTPTIVASVKKDAKPTASMAEALSLVERKAKRQARVEAKPKAEVKVARAERPAKKTKAVPAKASRHHVVKPKETLYRVATQYDLSVEELRKLNRMKPDDNTIRPGQKLRISS